LVGNPDSYLHDHASKCAKIIKYNATAIALNAKKNCSLKTKNSEYAENAIEAIASSLDTFIVISFDRLSKLIIRQHTHRMRWQVSILR